MPKALTQPRLYNTVADNLWGSNANWGEPAKGDKANSEPTTEVSFELFEPFELYYKYCGIADNHNGKQHASLSLQKLWATKQWEHCVFAFVYQSVRSTLTLWQ